jgi:hypothetical protein
MKVGFAADEWWPVWSVCDPPDHGTVADVPDDVVARWKRLEEEFLAAQKEMMTYADDAMARKATP